MPRLKASKSSKQPEDVMCLHTYPTLRKERKRCYFDANAKQQTHKFLIRGSAEVKTKKIQWLRELQFGDNENINLE